MDEPNPAPSEADTTLASPTKTAASAKQERLARALRQNLRRRKVASGNETPQEKS